MHRIDEVGYALLPIGVTVVGFVALILADPSDSATSNAALTLVRGSGIDELSIPVKGYVVNGAKTLQVDVKE